MARPINSKRKLTRVGAGKSLALIVPAEFIRSFGWRERQYLLLTKVPGGVMIRDAKTKKR
ncbi:MAG: hypothetical protein A3J07_03420 [Candidatus Doudnabacteria bacterium RIFCSPLOWO2_02_FULL_49_13]|uniref:SpoVT-AbrB domain-containing protein n=1 Tax=Candidatus Doudnabacteria bacterium RIFCSPHIGHO2_12_FULL_48_16 TaxID=1817838 RepID=A0A1F5PJX5_9BACT|nr:MAG: hypothetical protein A3B77_02225 [Candidatus Doudnabacteria bacterium RIFCSPHIGHO2_02_FULL_49_24]OGE89337.1 MAG: hypothetical protein A2760_03125 [Candidatus Doudnabacteria bacterium RIFCSPHIGHO2_01_FULL_50_67]OGE89972.1 MAG: hypothetical protein A3E29_02565 [Candidatus Doudnabacteria bacterium RIFCSPHIGHO2_12_FULL_48_16]OGE97483.1 MAG: hypothetical protein A2990_02070 [Candidatus Doudnabacteria bacterium RIFCSPLOWO2_01_FULL_49_40]OGF03113.1 MAG: hypothetical protein A3J07_03420 [Candid